MLQLLPLPLERLHLISPPAKMHCIEPILHTCRTHAQCVAGTPIAIICILTQKHHISLGNRLFAEDSQPFIIFAIAKLHRQPGPVIIHSQLPQLSCHKGYMVVRFQLPRLLAVPASAILQHRHSLRVFSSLINLLHSNNIRLELCNMLKEVFCLFIVIFLNNAVGVNTQKPHDIANLQTDTI